MEDSALERLTQREKEALRLVFSHRSLDAIARELGVSKSAVQQRMASAFAKTQSQDRFDIARTLARAEGWAPYTDRTDTNEQVGDITEVGINGTTGGVTELIDGLATLLGRKGASYDLTASQRLVRTALVAFATIIALSMLAASLGALGNAGKQLEERGVNHI